MNIEHRGSLCLIKKLISILIMIICLILLISIAVIMFSPRYVVDDPTAAKIHSIQFNLDFNGDGTDTEDFIEFDNETEILECLSKYTEKRTFSFANGYSFSDMELSIVIEENGKMKHIILGNINYSYETHGAMKFEISNADKLRGEILQLLDEKNWLTLETTQKCL